MTIKPLSDFHNFHFIVDNLEGNNDIIGVVVSIFKTRVRLIGMSTFFKAFYSYQGICKDKE